MIHERIDNIAERVKRLDPLLTDHQRDGLREGVNSKFGAGVAGGVITSGGRAMPLSVDKRGLVGMVSRLKSMEEVDNLLSKVIAAIAEKVPAWTGGSTYTVKPGDTMS